MENQPVIRRRRGEAGVTTTHIVRNGAIRRDPPGLTVTGLFAQ